MALNGLNDFDVGFHSFRLYIVIKFEILAHIWKSRYIPVTQYGLG